ncbi:MAG TPA: DUF481 domain-containing protein [Acidobacteriaceae bacterium]|jgi:hypothetical protein|nr:DUF481 domain-containing protein [Acidobacteriaceae bacterium]
MKWLLRISPRLLVCLLLAPLSMACGAEDKKAPAPEPDVLVLANGDTLHGTFVKEVSGTVTFHSDALGDLNVAWAKIQSLHVSEKVAVLSKTMTAHGKQAAEQIPAGPLDATNATVTVHAEGGAAPAPIPVKDAQYIVDKATLDKQLTSSPGFFTGWNGSATAGATLVSATQNQYTVSGSLGLMRVVPTVSWLDTRNRTSTDFSGSFGKITQPAYTSGGVYTPASTTKATIMHFDAERDQYVSPRFYALAQTALDHNYGQDLNLQQIYGGGMGWTVIKTPMQEADLKATVQYEKQDFIAGTGSTDQNLIGSTFAASYLRKQKLVTWTQEVAYIPAWNDTRAYSVNETNTFAFPAYKNFAFSVGTLDSYLNDPPATEPPTKRNSFQFTMGLTYAIKSKY